MFNQFLNMKFHAKIFPSFKISKFPVQMQFILLRRKLFYQSLNHTNRTKFIFNLQIIKITLLKRKIIKII